MHAPFFPPSPGRWRDLARTSPLAVLVDLDGTLIEFAPTLEEAVLEQPTVDVLNALCDVGVRVVVVSGRPSASIEGLRHLVPGAWWVAEHGSWRWNELGCMRPAIATELESLAAVLAPLLELPGALVERKSLSICVHWRRVAPSQRADFIAAVELACDAWLDQHAGFDCLLGVEMLEIRQRSAHKGVAVTWTREQVPGVKIIALGDDLTDEDMFAELGDGDAAIAVGERCDRRGADAAVAGPEGARELLRWIVAMRQGLETPVPVVPMMQARDRMRYPLVVISDRTPVQDKTRPRTVGGLVTALEPALRDAHGVWLGWSGTERSGGNRVTLDSEIRPPRATFDLSAAAREQFYGGFCNSALWPLLHGFSPRVRYTDDTWAAYARANEKYARHALSLAQPGGTIWVHDFHLLLSARALRMLGWRGRVGLFLHVPVPAPDVFQMVPWGPELLDAMLDFDLIGVQTERWGAHLLAAAQAAGHTIREDGSIQDGTCVTQVGVFPATIDVGVFRALTEEPAEVSSLRQTLGDRQLLLAVDRLDHAKGVPERLMAFERLLHESPAWRRRVCLLQIAVPSHAEVPDDVDLRRRVEHMVGRINGQFGDTDWVPVRYVYRAYDEATLAHLYRLADVMVVTPLRDGMNLVAKEFVAAQDPADPGVLVLSQHTGAAESLLAALITNPFHPEGFAADLERALSMTSGERQQRHGSLEQTLARGGSPAAWAAGFLDRLASLPARGERMSKPARR